LQETTLAHYPEVEKHLWDGGDELRTETRRIQKLIDEEFERIDLEDWK